MNFPVNDYVKVAAVSTVDTADAATKASPAVDMGAYEYVMFVVTATDANADTTIDAKIQSDSTDAFSSPTDIAGKAITQDTAEATATAYILQVAATDLNEGERYARVLVTAGNGTSGAELSIVAIGGGADYLPGANASEVVEVV